MLILARFVRTWTDEQLIKAIAETHSWRAATRALGMGSTSSYELVPRRAAELRLDTSHFRGKRSWTDEALAAAVAESKSWSGVGRRLHGGTSRESVDSMREMAPYGVADIAPSKATSSPGEPDNRSTRPDICELRNGGRVSRCRVVRITRLPGQLGRRRAPARPHRRQEWRNPTSPGQEYSSGADWRRNRGCEAEPPQSFQGRRHARRPQCYESTDFDLFFVLTGEGHVFLIPLRDVAGMTSMMVGPGSPYYVQTIGLSGR